MTAATLKTGLFGLVDVDSVRFDDPASPICGQTSYDEAW